MPNERQLTLDEACREIAQLQIDRRIDYIIVHHSWEPSAVDFIGIETVASIGRTHARWWPIRNDHGYHVQFGPSGEVFFCCPFEKVGAHAKGFNSRSIGVAYIADFGGGPTERRALDNPATYTGLAAGQLVVAALCERFGLDEEDVDFHSDYSSKTCPGTLMDKYEYRQAVARFMDGGVKVVVLTGDARRDFVIATSPRKDEWQELFGDREHIVLDAYKHLDDQSKVYIRKGGE